MHREAELPLDRELTRWTVAEMDYGPKASPKLPDSRLRLSPIKDTDSRFKSGTGIDPARSSRHCVRSR